MSWHVVGPVMQLNLDGMYKMVLVVFANEANDEGGNIQVAVPTAALKSGLAVRTVQRCVDHFQAAGVMIETEEVAGRGKARVWRIDLAAAKALYGTIPTFNLRRAMAERGETVPPPYNPRKAKKGDCQSPIPAAEKGDCQSEKGDCQSKKGDCQSPNPIKDPRENPARARDPAPGGGDAPAPGDQPTGPPANAHWKACQDSLAAHFGDQFGPWIKVLTPLRDDGETLVLGAQTRFIRDYVRDNFGQALGFLLGRQVEVIEHNFSLAAASRRLARVKAAETEAAS